jgi:hypothetical protein
MTTPFMSARKRDILIEHLDGQQVFMRNAHAARADGMEAKLLKHRWQAIDTLIQEGYLKEKNKNAITSKYTVITQSGRAALARLLADYAEALIASGYGDGEVAHAMPLPRTPETWLHLISRKRSGSLRPGPETESVTVSLVGLVADTTASQQSPAIEQ